jgi:predicted O-methyltransferase YrrM
MRCDRLAAGGVLVGDTIQLHGGVLKNVASSRRELHVQRIGRTPVLA